MLQKCWEHAFPIFPIIFNLVEISNKSFKVLLNENIQSKIVVTTLKKSTMNNFFVVFQIFRNCGKVLETDLKETSL